tara:strand:+ start:174 stop:587 length:414 start_codon:yes stop_codon:yes gene_type:complete
MSNLEIYPVLLEELSSIKNEILPILIKCYEHNADVYDVTPDQLIDLALDREYLIWIGKNNNIIEMICVTQLQKNSFFILIWATKSGWDFNLWYEPTLSKLESFAKSLGYSKLEALTRKGLARKLKWDHEYCIITKNL